MARICRSCFRVSGSVTRRMRTVSRIMAMPIWLPQTTYSSIKALSVGRMMNSVHGLNPERTTSPRIPDNSHNGSKLTTAQPGH